MVADFLILLCKEFMGKMSVCVPPQDIVRRLTQGDRAEGTRFIEFKDVLSSMVESYSFDIFLYTTYNSVVATDVLRLRESRIRKSVR